MTRVMVPVLIAGALCVPAVFPSPTYADGGQTGPGAGPQVLEDTHFFPDFELGPIMVSGWNFKTLQEAVDAIGTDPEVKGRTAVLIDNVEESITVPAGKELSIDLYAHRLNGTAGKPAITVKSGAKLTIEGSVADSAVLFAPTPGTPALVIEPGASVVMDSGSVKGAEGVTTPVVQNNGGTFVVLEGAKVEGEVLGGMDVHKHALSFVPEVPATCMVDGRPEYWHCDGCGLSFSDPEGRNTIRLDEQVIPHLGHLIGHVPAVEPTAQAEGNTEYWECDRCGLVFADAGLAQVIEKVDTVLPKVEAPTQGGSVQSVPAQPAPQQQASAGQFGFLPQTGDDSMLPGFAVGLIGMVVIAVGTMISHRRK